MDRKTLALLAVLQVSLLFDVAPAEAAEECLAQESALLKVIEASNHCNVAADCAGLRYSCGTAVNKTAIAKIEAAQNEMFSRCGMPALRCRHWTELTCEKNKCVTR